MDLKDIPNEKIYGRTTVVKDMHSRKRLMAEAVVSGGPGSGFIALPGGYGTFEELMEVVTWNQLVVLNVDGYWDGLMNWVSKAVDAGFVNERNQKIISEATDVEAAIDALKNYQACEGRFELEWIDKEV
ncbi:Bifunctional cytokinin biosynthesis protein [Lachnellula arida]|uniref:Bifunctional cytokinin biosynthesis protein n=1 Tax=Lachnellula arida TaxID=1316785 RepID=A0A8T9B3R6_9HELO|nr:Bifunctional cytokinin biosynthesis protein [Lachnellula arida]